MNIRTTKIVAPLVAMALCTPNISFAQEESKPTTISGSADVNDNFLLTRSISVRNGNNSISQDPKTIYVNPGDTINVKLDLKGKTASANHGFTSFKEVVSPIQASSPILGSRTAIKTGSPKPLVTTLDKLNYGTFEQTNEQTIEFKVNSQKSSSGFGEIGNQVTIDYSYTAGSKLGTYHTQFLPDPNFGLKTSDAEKLNLTIVVKNKERPAPPEQDEQDTPPGQGYQPAPPDQDEQDTPPDQDEQVIPPKSNKSTGFSWLTKALGVLAFLGGTVWFIIKHIFRL
ncbi:membrane protein [Corynebacterium diphtheriae]|nr:membrane protein [Corynebacterium diphtheriae]